MVVFCVFSKERKFIVAEEKSGLHKRELLKYRESFPRILVFEWSLSIEMALSLMISKKYHYVISFAIASNFYTSVDSVYPGLLERHL